jgi:hypothetical protein
VPLDDVWPELDVGLRGRQAIHRRAVGSDVRTVTLAASRLSSPLRSVSPRDPEGSSRPRPPEGGRVDDYYGAAPEQRGRRVSSLLLERRRVRFHELHCVCRPARARVNRRRLALRLGDAFERKIPGVEPGLQMLHHQALDLVVNDPDEFVALLLFDLLVATVCSVQAEVVYLLAELPVEPVDVGPLLLSTGTYEASA